MKKKTLLKSVNIIPDILMKAMTKNKQNSLKLDGVHLLGTVRVSMSTFSLFSLLNEIKIVTLHRILMLKVKARARHASTLK